MKSILLLYIITFLNCASSLQCMKRTRPVDQCDLRKEIFIKQYYKDYSFGLLQQISSEDPLKHQAFTTLIMQGHQKYIAFALNWRPEINGTLKPFSDCSISDLENGCPMSLAIQE